MFLFLETENKMITNTGEKKYHFPEIDNYGSGT